MAIAMMSDQCTRRWTSGKVNCGPHADEPWSELGKRNRCIQDQLEAAVAEARVDWSLRPSHSNMASVVSGSWFAKLHTESCVLIRDLSDCPGSVLWRTFLDASVKEKDTKNFILQLQGSTDPSTVPKWPESITVIPFIAEVASLPVAEYCKKLLQVVSSVKISSKKSALYIDSLNSLIVLFDSRTVCSILEEFTSKFTSVIAVVSSEILDIQLSTALTRLSSVIIRLQSFPSHKCTKADVTLRKEHRRLGLKIEKKEVYLRINDNNKERSIEFVNISQPLIDSSASDGEKHKQMDELSKLTFNLNLTESEKHARSNVQLPYVKRDTEAKVYYTPDEFDDLDEEDPDDDLGI